MVIGIGIGMIITSIINIIFINEKTNGIEEMNLKKFIKTTSENLNEVTNKSVEPCIEDRLMAQHIVKDNFVETDKAYIELLIEKGMNSEEIAKLLEKNKIIIDSDEFINIANKLDVTKQLKYGLKKIPKNSSIQDILEILIKIP